MPAKSKKQQKFMGMVHAVQKGEMKAPSKAVAETAKSIKPEAAKDYAETPRKGLPEKKTAKESCAMRLGKAAAWWPFGGSPWKQYGLTEQQWEHARQYAPGGDVAAMMQRTMPSGAQRQQFRTAMTTGLDDLSRQTAAQDVQRMGRIVNPAEIQALGQQYANVARTQPGMWANPVAQPGGSLAMQVGTPYQMIARQNPSLRAPASQAIARTPAPAAPTPAPAAPAPAAAIPSVAQRQTGIYRTDPRTRQSVQWQRGKMASFASRLGAKLAMMARIDPMQFRDPATGPASRQFNSVQPPPNMLQRPVSQTQKPLPAGPAYTLGQTFKNMLTSPVTANVFTDPAAAGTALGREWENMFQRR